MLLRQSHLAIFIVTANKTPAPAFLGKSIRQHSLRTLGQNLIIAADPKVSPIV